MKLHTLLDRFLDLLPAAADSHRIVVAFSGGPDSTALLAGLSSLANSRPLELWAAHLDHGLDPGSTERAEVAARIAARLGIPLIARRLEALAWAPSRATGGTESVEAVARRLRYAFLEESRQRVGAHWVATAHHRDDQIETVMLRILYGSGAAGLAGIAPVRGNLVRPLVEVPRSELLAMLAEYRLEPADDPTNRDLSQPRSRMRWETLPRLIATDPGLPDSVARVSMAAAAARPVIEARLRRRLNPRLAERSVTVDRSRLAALADPLWPFALALLHRLVGSEYPPREAVRRELRRQIDAGHGVGCDCGDDWRWSSRGSRLRLARSREPVPEFTYTLTVPGKVEIPELELSLRLSRGSIAAWMFRGSSTRAGLALPLVAGDRVTVRNRRPGDRIRPLGCRNRRRLKEVLIDRRIPRQERDRLPLLCLEDRVAWVPGVTIDEAFRLPADGRTWIAELTKT